MASEHLRGPVVVTGSGSALGRRVVEGLRAVGDDASVVGIGDLTDLSVDTLADRLGDAAVVVHLLSGSGPDLDTDAVTADDEDVHASQRLLDAVDRTGVAHLVFLSSATVYGAWSNNAMPLTEDATLRPVPELSFAVQRAEIERRLADWRHDHPEVTATVLRPAPMVGDDGPECWLARSLHAARKVADLEGDPPTQFVHIDDVAAAVVLSARDRLDGARNVAPDGWLRGDEYTALDAGTPKVRVPQRVGDRVARVRWALRLAPTPPGLVAYARHPWVVANDRLRADGWEPSYSNEEAFVAGTPATALATLSPRRRQELALGVTGGVIAAGAAGAVWALARARRR